MWLRLGAATKKTDDLRREDVLTVELRGFSTCGCGSPGRCAVALGKFVPTTAGVEVSSEVVTMSRPCNSLMPRVNLLSNQARELDRIANKVGACGGEAVGVVVTARQLPARVSRSRRLITRDPSGKPAKSRWAMISATQAPCFASER
ncbi:MAG: hypothetical protein M3Y09_07740 [Actinomycetota bacterium]|nr:hypothetical protein [Actinomycetota bacterium]